MTQRQVGSRQYNKSRVNQWPPLTTPLVNSASNQLLNQHHSNMTMQDILHNLAQLSQIKRWIIWIAPPFMPSVSELTKFGVDVTRVVVIPPSQIKNHFTTIENALQSGTFSTVLAWFNDPSSNQLQTLKAAAARGSTVGYIFGNEDKQTVKHNQTLALINMYEPTHNGLAHPSSTHPSSTH